MQLHWRAYILAYLMKLPFFLIIITLQFHSLYNTDCIPLLPLIILSASEKQLCSILSCNSFDLNFYLIPSKFFFETFKIRNIKYCLLLPFVSIWDYFPMTPQHICSCSNIFSAAHFKIILPIIHVVLLTLSVFSILQG